MKTYLTLDDMTYTQTLNAHGDDVVTLVPAGPSWMQPGTRIRLGVPDAYDLVAKHVMATVLSSLGIGAAA